MAFVCNCSQTAKAKLLNYLKTGSEAVPTLQPIFGLMKLCKLKLKVLRNWYLKYICRFQMLFINVSDKVKSLWKQKKIPIKNTCFLSFRLENGFSGKIRFVSLCNKVQHTYKTQIDIKLLNYFLIPQLLYHLSTYLICHWIT